MMRREKSNGETAFDPPVQIADDGRQVRIWVSLPGVAEEQIRIDLEQATFTLSVTRGERVVTKSVPIPRGARFFKKKFSGDMLEIVLERPPA